jgi:hypothetical protein
METLGTEGRSSARRSIVTTIDGDLERSTYLSHPIIAQPAEALY